MIYIRGKRKRGEEGYKIYINVEIQNVMIGRFVDALFEVLNDTCV